MRARPRRQRGSGAGDVPGGTGPSFAAGPSPVGAVPTETIPLGDLDTALDEEVATDKPWLVIVWNDPINLMSYVTYVLQKLFGYSKDKATALMLDVHHKGRAVVSSGTRERAELDVYRLHEHGLWATMEQAS